MSGALILQDDNSVFEAFFVAAKYPTLVTALKLTGLKEAKPTMDGVLEVFDYVVRAPREAIDHVSPAARGRFDSMVQLFVHKESEAQWIPLVEQLLGEAGE